jgi:Ca-activated chloride channel family protein
MLPQRPHFFALCAGLAFALCASPQASQVFKSATRAVPIYATVTDSSGRLVTDLTAKDFQIDDNGTRQVITVFKNGLQPITIAMLLDASPSLFPVYGRTAEAVTEFAKQLRPGDRACLGRFSQSVTLDPQLTGDAETLLKGLAMPAPWPAGTALWDAIEAGRSALGAEGGRRVVLVVTDGADNASRVDPNVTRTRLQREGVLVYAIAVRGRFGFDMSELGALANATGGRAIELQSAADVPSTMQGIADELHQQYVLGFAPETLDDRLHRLDVKVKGAGFTVRAPRMYFAARAEAR